MGGEPKEVENGYKASKTSGGPSETCSDARRRLPGVVNASICVLEAKNE